MISLKASGFGLSLTEADYCSLIRGGNPATEAQAVDRIHRWARCGELGDAYR
jgi:SNF2 family DNA or RNA helicase